MRQRAAGSMSGELTLKLTANGFPGCDACAHTARRQRPTAPLGRASRQTRKHHVIGADETGGDGGVEKKKNDKGEKKAERPRTRSRPNPSLATVPSAGTFLAPTNQGSHSDPETSNCCCRPFESTWVRLLLPAPPPPVSCHRSDLTLPSLILHHFCSIIYIC